MDKVLTSNTDIQKEQDNNKIREKLKLIIKNNKKYNLRDLSRILKKNDAYLQQYLYRGTPKILPEEFRHKLAMILSININELTPNWLKQLMPEEKLIKFKNIEINNSFKNISISQQLLLDVDLSKIDNLFFFQTTTKLGILTTVVDISKNQYINPDLYLLNDKNNFFLAFLEMNKDDNTKMSVKPYYDTFNPFHITSKLLNISGMILWQSSKTFRK